ncbi:MAG: Acyltransferase domain protein, partial [Bacteroidetes bacterium]|nr:Acyltransferase domain protein [Bacteroidota bacterium]
MPPSKRLSFIDLLRGWAVIVMIETHVVNATIRPETAAQPWFDIINFINGLVAPSFLFASGMAYAVTTRRKLDSYVSFGTPLFRQLWRLLFILLLGYGLHIPKFNLGQMVQGVSEGQWLGFFQSDVLHCIAVSLLILQMILLIVRTERRLYLIAAGLAVALL